jgi:hypothetical protein
MELDLMYSHKWAYLSQEDSDLYDTVIDSDDTKDKSIKKMLEDKAESSRKAYQNSTY